MSANHSSPSYSHVLQLDFCNDGSLKAYCDDNYKHPRDVVIPVDFCIDGILTQALNLFPKIKFTAIAFITWEHILKNEYLKNQCKEFCVKNSYLYFFSHSNDFMRSSVFLYLKPIVDENERVVVLEINRNFYLSIVTYSRLNCRFRFESCNIFDIPYSISKTTMLYILEKLAEIQPKKIILFVSSMNAALIKYFENRLLKIKKILDDKYEVILYNKDFSHLHKYFYYVCLDLMGEKVNLFNVDPYLVDRCRIDIALKGEKHLCKIDYCSLPIKKTFKIIVASKDDYLQKEFSLFIEENGESKLIKSAYGNEKTPLFISFFDEQGIVGEEAKQHFDDEEKEPSVIYDLMKIASITSLEEDDLYWAFWLRMHPETNDIAVVCVTPEGNKFIHRVDLFFFIFKYCEYRIYTEKGATVKKFNIQFEGFNPCQKVVDTILMANEEYKNHSNTNFFQQ